MIQNSFVGGVWSPRLHKRFDLENYQNAARQLENVIIHPQGGVSNRGGTKYIGQPPDTDSYYPPRLIPFRQSNVRDYILELSTRSSTYSVMKVITDGGYVLTEPGSILYLRDFLDPYGWTTSTVATEVYCTRHGGSVCATKPDYVTYYDPLAGTYTDYTEGTLGSLSSGEWAYGDNDSLGYDTMYFRGATISDYQDYGIDLAWGGSALILNDRTYVWTESSTGGEWYVRSSGSGNPSLDEPEDVYNGDSLRVKGTLGSLSSGEWAYGDNDSLGYDTIYVKRTGDPNDAVQGVVTAVYEYELDLPYYASDLAKIQYVQKDDTLYLAHASYAPRKIVWTSDAVWTLSEVAFGSDVPAPTGLGATSGTTSNYAITAIYKNADGSTEESVMSTPVTGEPGATFTWDADANAHNYAIYKDLGKSGDYRYIAYAGDETYTEPSTGAEIFSGRPPEPRYDFDDTDDYPAGVTVFEQRLIWLRTNNNLRSIWGSKTGNYENMDTSDPLQDDDAFGFMIAAQSVNEILWAIPLNVLIVGTTRGEFVMKPGSNSAAITPSSVDIKKQSSWGASDITPLAIDNAVLFVDRSLKSVRDLTYNYEIDGYKGNDLAVMAEHLFRDLEIVDWAYQAKPDSILWCVLSDGKVAGLTYLREHGVFAWHLHDFGGVVKHITCVNTVEGTDDVYIVINREIENPATGGRRTVTTDWYIEKLMPRMPVNQVNEVSIKDAYIVDCGLSYDTYYGVTDVKIENSLYFIKVSATAFVETAGDYIDFDGCLSVPELNESRFRIGFTSGAYFALEQLTPLSIISDDYLWTESSTSNEYYLTLAAGTDPSISVSPTNIYASDVALPRGTLGSLNANEWAYGDNDTLGFSTIYVRLASDADPETKANGYLKRGVGVDYSGFDTFIVDDLTYIRKAVLTISGLDHLEGKDVSVLADGEIVNGLTVSSGSITLTQRASRVHVGLPYTSIVETLDFNVPGSNILDKRRDVKSAMISFERTRAIEVGPNEDNLDEIIFEDNTNYGGDEDHFTGEKEIFLSPNEFRQSRLYFKNSDPVPFTILGIMTRLEYSDK